MATDPRIVQARPHYVYRVYGARGRLLYVGCSSNLDLRKRDHRLWSEWWARAKRWEIEGPYAYATGRAVELAAIKSEHPTFNRTGRVPNYSPRRRSAAA